MIRVFPNIEELNFFAAAEFIKIARLAIQRNGSFTVALAGGSTPKSLYRSLSGEKIRKEIDWKKCFFFFGDERNVLPADAESNFRMARENLFEPLHLPDKNILRWNTEERDAEKIAEDYETSLSGFFALDEIERFPRFDLILLGMGADGHTASLFPYTTALHENKRLAVANYVEKLNSKRLTMTFPVINNAANVIFLVSGEEKAETLKRVLQGNFQPEKFPSQSVKPKNGDLFWLIDEKAAQFLT